MVLRTIPEGPLGLRIARNTPQNFLIWPATPPSLYSWHQAPTHTQSARRFTDQFLEDLRARLPVAEVVGKRVKLKKSGREWRGLSPFQQEKTPSFFANDQKQAWIDFFSGKNGNIINFVMETDGLPFAEAVERLASMAGLPLPAVTP